MSIKNSEMAKILREIGGYYEMKNEPFKPRAYERAADSLDALDEQAGQIYKEAGFKGLRTIPGIGQGIAEHIEELLKSGRLKKYDSLKKQMPVNLAELTSISGLGAKTAGELYKKLKIKNLKDLKRAVASHRLQKIKGFGKKTEENIVKALESKGTATQRYLLGYIYPIIERLRVKLESSGQFEKLIVGGSYRRKQETVGDIDVLAIAKNPKQAMDYFVNLPEAGQVVAHGVTKSAIRLNNGIQVDLLVVPPKSWGAAMIYFTGDLAHNIKMRKIAIDKGWKLSGTGLYKGKKLIAGISEEEVYKKLGLKQVPPPEIRTDSGEIEAALRQAQGKPGGLPKLIEYDEVRGDLQVQTSWTDGKASIEDMAMAAMALGREYIAITDHTKTLYMTGGLDEKKILQQGKEIERVNKKLRGKIRILKGAEVNILKDGTLDIADSTLAKLDVVGASIHSHFKLSREDQTKRIIRALSNPNVDIFFHPTTRIIQRRDPIDFDFEEVLKAAKKYRAALEINSYPDRLDLHDKMIRQTVEAGVKLVINTDAHAPKHLEFIQYGIAQARRGWATKKDILNTMTAEELLQYLTK